MLMQDVQTVATPIAIAHALPCPAAYRIDDANRGLGVPQTVPHRMAEAVDRLAFA